MTRRGRGVGGGSRVNLRGFSQLLKHLPPSGRLRLESVFVDAEQLIDYSRIAVTGKINRRILNPVLETPIVTVTNCLLGGTITWVRLKDPKLQFYEIDVDDVNVFPNPTTYESFADYFSLERLTSTKFLRVRGVRMDGQVGPWSDTAQIDPSLSAPRAHTWNFYQRYEGSDPSLETSIEFGGEPSPKFYTLFEHEFYTTRNVGGMGVYGYVSNRLRDDLNSDRRPWDRVRFSVNGIARSEGYFPHWTDGFGDERQSGRFDAGQFYGEPVSFYSKGGYTASFGPYGITYPNNQRGDGWKDPRRITNFIDSEEDDTIFYWHALNDAKRPARWDRSILTDVHSPKIEAAESYSTSVGAEEMTSYMRCQDFGFSVPEDKNITGIKVGIKRRQTIYGPDQITPDFVTVPGVPNRPFRGQGGTEDPTTNMSTNDIAEDDTGRFLFFNSDEKHVLYSGDDVSPFFTNSPGFGMGQDWTWSGWVNNTAGVGDGVKYIWGMKSETTAAQKTWDIPQNSLIFRLQFNMGGGTPLLQLYLAESVGSIYEKEEWPTTIGSHFELMSWELGDVMPTLGAWYHLVVTYEGFPEVGTWEGGAVPLDPYEVGTVKVYVNGSDIGESNKGATPRTPKTWFNNPVVYFCAGDLEQGYCNSPFGSGSTLTLDGGLTQIAHYNRALDDGEILGLAQAGMNVDLRGSSRPSGLIHYHLFLPNEPSIRDYNIHLIDSEGVIRADLPNYALRAENWPALHDFFYIDESYFYGEYVAYAGGVSGGIPHDSVTGIGYQEYGGTTDLWGAKISESRFYATVLDPAAINNPNWGVAIRAKNDEPFFDGHAYIDHVHMAVFWQDPDKSDYVSLKVEAESTTDFYTIRQVFGGVFNGIEVGEQL